LSLPGSDLQGISLKICKFLTYIFSNNSGQAQEGDDTFCLNLGKRQSIGSRFTESPMPRRLTCFGQCLLAEIYAGQRIEENCSQAAREKTPTSINTRLNRSTNNNWA
jgi:hypothetical protein